jgi:hypothetical protein
MRPHRTVRTILATVALTTAALGATALPASATTSSSGGTFTAFGTCNSYYHRLSMTGSMQLSNRYPNGQWVASRYAFWKVNSAGTPISASTYTTWATTWAKPGTVALPYTALGGAETVGQVTDLPGLTYSASGYYKIAMQVGVWNGSTYEFAPWDFVSSYSVWNQWGALAQANVCAASVAP